MPGSLGIVTVIRQATIQDLPGVYRVCLQTGDSGKDGTALFHDPDLLGHLFAGPYVLGQPDYALVVSDERGIAGYAFAAEDTKAFEQWAEKNWWPPLRELYPLADGDSPDAELIRLLHVRPVAQNELLAEFPAHLHIDLLPRLQGRRFGRQLIEMTLDRLRQRGVKGVHLEVGVENLNAISFYRHLGFEAHPGLGAEVMGMRLV